MRITLILYIYIFTYIYILYFCWSMYMNRTLASAVTTHIGLLFTPNYHDVIGWVSPQRWFSRGHFTNLTRCDLTQGFAGYWNIINFTHTIWKKKKHCFCVNRPLFDATTNGSPFPVKIHEERLQSGRTSNDCRHEHLMANFFQEANRINKVSSHQPLLYGLDNLSKRLRGNGNMVIIIWSDRGRMICWRVPSYIYDQRVTWKCVFALVSGIHHLIMNIFTVSFHWRRSKSKYCIYRHP